MSVVFFGHIPRKKKKKKNKRRLNSPSLRWEPLETLVLNVYLFIDGIASTRTAPAPFMQKWYFFIERTNKKQKNVFMFIDRAYHPLDYMFCVVVCQICMYILYVPYDLQSQILFNRRTSLLTFFQKKRRKRARCEF